MHILFGHIWTSASWKLQVKAGAELPNIQWLHAIRWCRNLRHRDSSLILWALRRRRPMGVLEAEAENRARCLSGVLTLSAQVGRWEHQHLTLRARNSDLIQGLKQMPCSRCTPRSQGQVWPRKGCPLSTQLKGSGARWECLLGHGPKTVAARR